MDKTKVSQIFWGISGKEPTLDVFVQFHDGSESLIASIPMPEGTDERATDDPKTEKLAMGVARELGYEIG